MEHVYIALTRHMATRRTPAPEDNREELEDRFRFKQLVMSFVEDLIFDWHPWATRQVKGTLISPPLLSFSSSGRFPKIILPVIIVSY